MESLLFSMIRVRVEEPSLPLFFEFSMFSVVLDCVLVEHCLGGELGDSAVFFVLLVRGRREGDSDVDFVEKLGGVLCIAGHLVNAVVRFVKSMFEKGKPITNMNMVVVGDNVDEALLSVLVYSLMMTQSFEIYPIYIYDKKTHLLVTTGKVELPPRQVIEKIRELTESLPLPQP